MKQDTITKNTVAVEGRVLAKALKPILSVIEKRNTYPILGMIKLAVDGPNLTLVGTDLDIEISHRLDANQATGKWEACVDPRTLASIARQAGPALVNMWLSAKFSEGIKADVVPELVVSIDGDTEYRLPVLDTDAFPSLPGTRIDMIERFTNGRLSMILDKVVGYVSSEETRYYLNGVCWQLRENGARFVATDGHRLGVCRYGSDRTPMPDMIIPRKAVKIIRKIAAADVEIFGVEMKGHSKIDIVAGPITVRTKLIEGTFPDVDRVTPKIADSQIKIEAYKDELLQAIDRAAVIRQRHSTALRFYGKDGIMHISSNSPDHGTAVARTRVAWPGGIQEFGLNATYVRDMAVSCDGSVTFHMRDAGHPVLVLDEDPEMTRVLMPMRV